MMAQSIFILMYSRLVETLNKRLYNGGRVLNEINKLTFLKEIKGKIENINFNRGHNKLLEFTTEFKYKFIFIVMKHS